MRRDQIINVVVRPLYRIFRGGMAANRILILHTRGRRTGEWHALPLNYLPDRNGYAVIASNWGRPVMPAWYFNLRADPNVKVELAGRRVNALAEVVSQTDHDRLWPTFVQIHPPYLNYRKRTKRDFPIVRLTPRA